MSTWLDVEQLYLPARKDVGRALRLLPLVKVGPSPQSAKNACYFFNRLERDGARFVSYHFTDRPEVREGIRRSSHSHQITCRYIVQLWDLSETVHCA